MATCGHHGGTSIKWIMVRGKWIRAPGEKDPIHGAGNHCLAVKPKSAQCGNVPGVCGEDKALKHCVKCQCCFQRVLVKVFVSQFHTYVE